MSKIKSYLDSSVLNQIVSGDINLSEMTKIEFVTSMQAVMEFCLQNGLQKKVNEVIRLLVNNCKIRSIDYEVVEKFGSIFNENFSDFNLKDSALYLHFSVAMLENCEYFITNEKIKTRLDIKLSDLSSLKDQSLSHESSQGLFDLL